MSTPNILPEVKSPVGTKFQVLRDLYQLTGYRCRLNFLEEVTGWGVAEASPGNIVAATLCRTVVTVREGARGRYFVTERGTEMLIFVRDASGLWSKPTSLRSVHKVSEVYS